MWYNEVDLTHQREPLQGCYSQQTRTLEAVYHLEGNNPSISPSFCGGHLWWAQLHWETHPSLVVTYPIGVSQPIRFHPVAPPIIKPRLIHFKMTCHCVVIIIQIEMAIMHFNVATHRVPKSNLDLYLVNNSKGSRSHLHFWMEVPGCCPQFAIGIKSGLYIWLCKLYIQDTAKTPRYERDFELVIRQFLWVLVLSPLRLQLPMGCQQHYRGAILLGVVHTKTMQSDHSMI